jgi:hypothetical protein
MPRCGSSCMLSSPRLPACIGRISILISLSNPSDVFRSCQHPHAQHHVPLNKRRQNLSHNQKAVGAQLPSERRPKNKTQAFHGVRTSLTSVAMYKAMKEKTQFNVRINTPASYRTSRYSFATYLLESGYDFRTSGLSACALTAARQFRLVVPSSTSEIGPW